MFRVDDPRSEPSVLHELTQNKMSEDADSDVAIRFVDEKDYREISTKAESAKRKLKYSSEILNALNILSGSFIIYSLKKAISGLIFILLFVFYYSTQEP